MKNSVSLTAPRDIPPWNTTPKSIASMSDPATTPIIDSLKYHCSMIIEFILDSP